jgi:methylglutaconyl-CoA hydratase
VPALVEREQDPFAGRPQCEQAVEPAGDEVVDVRAERRFVERGAVVAQGRNRSGQGTFQHRRNSMLTAVSALRIERDGPVLRIAIARPERRNAFDAALIAELTAAFSDVADARVVILAGDGPSFCAGADVDWQRSAIDLSYDENVEDAMRLYRMMEAIDGCPAPVVARVQGYALGGGSGVVACCDVAIAGEDAVFGFSEVKLGIIPAVISPFVVPRIGAGAARRYFLTGERFDAQTALRIGLVHEVTRDLDTAVDRVVGELLTSGPEAAREAKRLVRERPTDVETAHIVARLRTSPEGQDGLRAFLERRAAGQPEDPWGVFADR